MLCFFPNGRLNHQCVVIIIIIIIIIIIFFFFFFIITIIIIAIRNIITIIFIMFIIVIIIIVIIILSRSCSRRASIQAGDGDSHVVDISRHPPEATEDIQVTTRICCFFFCGILINLHLPLASWEGEYPKANCCEMCVCVCSFVYTCIILWLFICSWLSIGCLLFSIGDSLGRVGLPFFRQGKISKNMLAAGLMSRYTSLPVPPFGSHETHEWSKLANPLQ